MLDREREPLRGLHDGDGQVHRGRRHDGAVLCVADRRFGGGGRGGQDGAFGGGHVPCRVELAAGHLVCARELGVRARPTYCGLGTSGRERFDLWVCQCQVDQAFHVLDLRAMWKCVGNGGEGVQVGEAAGVRGQPMLGVGELADQVVQADAEPRLQLAVRLDRRDGRTRPVCGEHLVHERVQVQTATNSVRAPQPAQSGVAGGGGLRLRRPGFAGEDAGLGGGHVGVAVAQLLQDCGDLLAPFGEVHDRLVRDLRHLPHPRPRRPGERDPELAVQERPNLRLGHLVDRRGVPHQIPTPGRDSQPAAVRRFGHVRDSDVHMPVRITHRGVVDRAGGAVGHHPPGKPARLLVPGGVPLAVLAAPHIRGAALDPPEGALDRGRVAGFDPIHQLVGQERQQQARRLRQGDTDVESHDSDRHPARRQPNLRLPVLVEYRCAVLAQNRLGLVQVAVGRDEIHVRPHPLSVQAGGLGQRQRIVHPQQGSVTATCDRPDSGVPRRALLRLAEQRDRSSRPRSAARTFTAATRDPSGTFASAGTATFGVTSCSPLPGCRPAMSARAKSCCSVISSAPGLSSSRPNSPRPPPIHRNGRSRPSAR